MDNQELTDKQTRFIELYFKCNNVKEICDKMGITKQTYYNYLNNENVKAQIDMIRASIITDTAIFLQSNLKTCSDKLMEMINDPKTPPHIKISAINSVFNNCSKLTEQIDIIDKINKLDAMYEEMLQKSDNKTTIW